MTTLLMEYARERETYHAVFLHDGQRCGAFDGGWTGMLQALARFVAEHPGAALTLQRTDRENIPPYVVSDYETQLFRDDPVQAIRNWTVEV